MGSGKVESAFIIKHIQQSIEVKQQILNSSLLINDLFKVAEVCKNAFKNGNKVILAGNGGSAADAQHIAAEFVSRFRFDRPGLPSLSLATDTSMLTAISNDYGYDKLFSRQLEANGKEGDIFIAISTSGNSKNIIEGVKSANKMGIVSVALTGETGGELKACSDHTICIPSSSTAFIQESHIMVGHIICGYVEDELFSQSNV